MRKFWEKYKKNYTQREIIWMWNNEGKRQRQIEFWKKKKMMIKYELNHAWMYEVWVKKDMKKIFLERWKKENFDWITKLLRQKVSQAQDVWEEFL